MPRLAILNMLMGFVILFLAASAGAFISFDMTESFLFDPEGLFSWRAVLQRSAHGHTNMFGMLHILFGLTMPYSRCSQTARVLQTLGLFMGSLAMGPGMMLRAYVGPVDGNDALGLVLGLLLSAALLALIGHSYGLARKYLARV